MKIKVLILRGNSPDLLVRDEMEVSNVSDLESVKSKTLPAAYLLSEKDLSLLRKFKEAIVDRGHKHKAKGLAKLVIGYEKIPLINGNFASTHQVQRSARTLLENAKKENDLNAYFIGIEDRIFQELRNSAKEKTKKEDQRKKLQKRAHQPFTFSDIPSWISRELGMQCQVPDALVERYVGVTRDVVLVRQLIVLAARIDDPVLILGDTGTGKEVVAREIHYNSNRETQPFVPINCGGVPTDLFGSELFGHAKGSFTGAIKDKEGMWQFAVEGTLFLDEVADLSPGNQAKLLRALEDGFIRPIGKNEEIKVNARILAATNRDLFSMVRSNEFREDLYYRLRGFIIRTPSLRNNPENIPVLAQYLWRNITSNKDKTLPNEVVKKLGEYRWPGNVRELKMVLQNLYGLFGTDNLHEDHLKAVFYMEGQKSLPPGIRTDLPACVKHLKRAQEVIRSIELRIRNFSAPRQATDAAEISFGLGMNELRTICQQPSLFHSDSSFSAVWDLLKLLNQFHEKLQKGIKETKKDWKKELAKEFSLAHSAISKEIEKILEEL